MLMRKPHGPVIRGAIGRLIDEEPALKLPPKEVLEHLLAALVEQTFEDLSPDGASPVPAPPMVESGKGWIQFRNVFIALRTKLSDPPEDEIGELIATLRAALSDWSPSALRAAVAFARAEVRRAGLHGEVLSLPSDKLEAGWWYSILSAANAQDQTRRIERLAVDLLAGVGDVVGANVATFMGEHVRGPEGNHRTAMTTAKKLARVVDKGEHVEFNIGHALNGFLSCERYAPAHITCGTVFALQVIDRSDYFVCVNPACDMVPRVPSGNYHWLSNLHPWRPMLALRLTPVESLDRKSLALSTAPHGRWLFVDDGGPRVLDIRSSSESDQLSHEMFFVAASDHNSDRSVELRRVVSSGLWPTPALSAVRARIVAQLRPPYAEHLLNLASRHLSRVGTDYFGLPHRRFRDG